MALLKVWEYEFYGVQTLPRPLDLGGLKIKLDLSELTSVLTGPVLWFTMLHLLQTSVCFSTKLYFLNIN